MISILTHPGKRGTANTCGKPHRRAAQAAAVLLVAAALSGCQGISMNSAQLRVIDASPDAGVIDSYQDNAALAYNLAFGTMTTYVPVSPGFSTLAADRAGTRQALVTGTDTLVAGRQYTEIVGSGLANMQQTLFQDQTSPAPAGEIAVRVINESMHAGAVDAYLVPTGSTSSGRLASAVPVATNLSFGANSSYIDAPAGSYALDVVPAGTELGSSTATLLSGEQVSYASGAVRTAVLIDQQTPATQRESPTPHVQAILADDADAQ